MKNESENERLTRLLNIQQIQPNDVFVQYAIALEWLKEKHYHQAITSLRKVLEIDPAYLAAYYQLGQTYLAMSNTTEAIAVFEKGISIAGKARDLKTLAELKNALLNAQIDD